MKKSTLIILITVSIIFCLTQTIYAKTFHVADGRELFLAFSEASNNGENDIIYLAAGVYKGEFIFETSEANSLTLTSEPGLKAEQVIFDGEEMVRPLYISADASADIGVENITVRNGKTSDNGGGIYITTFSTVTVFNNIITGNSSLSSYGGGVYIYTNGNVALNHNIISDNNSGGNGAGFYIQNIFGELIITDNKITGNIATGYNSKDLFAKVGDNISIHNNYFEGSLSASASGSISLSCNVLSEKHLYLEGNGTKNIINNNFISSGINVIGGNISISNNTISNGFISSSNRNDESTNNISIIHNVISGSFIIIFIETNGFIYLTKNTLYGDSKGDSSGIYLYSKRDILFSDNNIKNLVWTDSGNYYFNRGLLSIDCENIIFNNNKISQNIHHNRSIFINAQNDITAKKNVITNNSGGGIYLSNKVINAILTDNIIETNTLLGAFYTQNTGSLILSNNTITGNNAIESYNATSIDINSNIIKGSKGKGIYITSTSGMSYTCTINNNVITGFDNSSKEGAGIFVENFELIDIAQNLIANNKAAKGAGLFLNPASTLFMNNNTIADNIAEEQGGGLYVKTSNMLYNLSLGNNIFWNNSAAIEGDDIYLYGFGGNPRVLDHNNVGEIVGTFENSSNNLSIDPLFYSPETGDYHLRPNSPCINAGNTYFMSDLDDTSILAEGDIGAYEYNPTIPHPADTNKNFIIEESEYTSYNNSWHENLPWSTEQTEIAIEYNTRAGFLIENGGSYTNTGAMKPLCWTPNN